MKRFASLLAVVGTLAGGGAMALTQAAATASPSARAAALPTLNIALSGTKGVSVSGSMVSGAVNIVRRTVEVARGLRDRPIEPGCVAAAGGRAVGVTTVTSMR